MQQQPLLPASHFKIEPTWTEAYRVSDYMRAAGRRWKLAILTALVGLGAAYGWCWLMPDSYVSYAQLLFMPPQVSEKFVETNISLHADQRVTALTQMIGSHATAGKMIQEFGLYPRLRRWWPVADLVPQFRSDLDIRVIGAGRTDGRRAVPTVQISFRYTDPQIAQKVVQRILEVIYEENQRIRSNQTFRTTDFLQRQTKEVHDQLEQAEQRLEALRLGDPAARLQATALATEKLHEVHRRLYATQLDLRRAIAEREQKQLHLESLKERSANPAREATKSIDASWAMQGWRMKLAELRAKADEAQLRYREGHPDREAAVRDVERALAELKRVEETDRQHNENQLKQRLVDQLERTRADVNGLDASIATMKREEISLLTQEKEAIERSLPNEQAAFQNLAALREHELLKIRYAELLKKQRDSEVATEMERIGQGETIDLIEPPILPTTAKLPVRWMKLAMGAATGLLFGLMVPVLALIHRPRIQSAHRLEALLGAPLLGELPASPRLGPAGFTAMKWRGRKIRLVISTQSHLLLLLLLLLAVTTGCAHDSAASLVERGHAAWKKGKPAEAALLFRRAIQEDKRFGPAYRAMADLALEQSDAPAARRALIRAVELLPEEPALRVKLAELSFRLYFADPSRPESLLRELEILAGQIVEQGPKQPDGYRLRAQVLLERRRLRDAVASLEEGLQQIPGEPALITQLASALYQDGDTARAAAVLETLITAASPYPPAYDLFYMQLMEAGRRQQGESVLRAKWKAVGSLDSGLQLAAHLDATGARDAALEVLDTVAEKHSAHALAPLQIADFWINRADPARARQWLDRGRRAHPSAGPEYAGRQIELLLGANQRDAALALLAAEQKNHPGNPLLAAYRSAIELDDPGSAALRQTRVHLEAILNRMPNSPFVRYHLGRAYLREGDVARAGDQFERCVTLDPNYAMGWLALAEAHLRQGQYSRAAEESKYLEHRGAAFASVYLLNARAELGRNRPAEAERALELLLRLDPSHNEAKLLMSQTKLALGQTAGARKQLYELLNRPVDQPETLVAAARLEAALGQPEKAIERLRKAGDQKPDSLVIGAGIAQLAARLGRHEEALAHFQRLVEKQPASLEYSLGLANTLALLKKNSEAADQYRKVQTMSGADPRPWLNYAVMMAESGDWEQARRGYREALRREPRNPIALNNLADLLSRQGGDLSEALNFAEQAGRMLPDAPEVIDTLAYVYLQKGMMRNAIASYQKLMDRVSGPERGRIRARIERIERGDAAGVLAETRPARM